ncbi:hypothetical protein AVEN_111138-1 [Araneus ventricosus]|uniref:Uncharacterized protein n=1 Tax=Araneus ventricosus TaxID=182803 RepID=A0A4Y2C6R5_ARAVE|nr:hypothetical protein AVEN_111138-1 [Araneus ventricosus]
MPSWKIFKQQDGYLAGTYYQMVTSTLPVRINHVKKITKSNQQGWMDFGMSVFTPNGTSALPVRVREEDNLKAQQQDGWILACCLYTKMAHLHCLSVCM